MNTSVVLRRGLCVALLYVGSLLLTPAMAAELRVLTPEQLPYRAEPAAPGAQIAVVAGDPSRGPYTIRARFEPGARTPPHAHPDERVVTVLQGLYRLAVGASGDAANLKDYGPGTVLIVPAGLTHYSAAGPAGAEVQESGTGPTAFLPAPR